MVRALTVLSTLFAGAALWALGAPSFASDGVVMAPVAQVREPVSAHRETAIFAGGCFWGVQGVFSHVNGVIETTAGYTGGKASTAEYETVSTGTTGHAESVRVVFDPAKVNYADLLRIYFSVVADPTRVNAQGPDEGPQYRTALFPMSAAQTTVAKAYISQLGSAHVYRHPIVTTLESNSGFFPAEAYHQNFMAQNPNYPYIVVNDRPKVEALKKMFPKSYRA